MLSKHNFAIKIDPSLIFSWCNETSKAFCYCHQLVASANTSCCSAVSWVMQSPQNPAPLSPSQDLQSARGICGTPACKTPIPKHNRSEPPGKCQKWRMLKDALHLQIMLMNTGNKPRDCRGTRRENYKKTGWCAENKRRKLKTFHKLSKFNKPGENNFVLLHSSRRGVVYFPAHSTTLLTLTLRHSNTIQKQHER